MIQIHTIRDIAKLSGVSVSTVSRVLNHHPDVSEKVREKVLQVVEELHYVPNSNARDLVRSPEKAIGLVMRGMSNPFFSELFRWMEAAAQEAGYSFYFQQIHSNEDAISLAARMTKAKKLRGMIFLGGRFDYREDEIKAIPVPLVTCTASNSFLQHQKLIASSISIDDEETAYQGMKRILDAGHQRIALLLVDREDQSVSELRYRGCCRAIEEHPLHKQDLLVLETGSYQMADAYRILQQELRNGLRFSALFAISDTMALASMKALADQGWKVPEDCSVLGIDGIEWSQYAIPTLSTLEQPKEAMGRGAVQLLLDLIENHRPHQRIILPTHYREGGTFRPYSFACMKNNRNGSHIS